MTLIVHELQTSLFQEKSSSRHSQVYAVRPHLYIHNRPTGTLKVQITEQDDTLIAESATITIADITDSNEYHGFVTFEVSAFLRKDTVYRFTVVAGGGYSFSNSGYVGVCNDFDQRIYPLDYSPASTFEYPLAFQIWSRFNK